MMLKDSSSPHPAGSAHVASAYFPGITDTVRDETGNPDSHADTNTGLNDTIIPSDAEHKASTSRK